LGGEFFLVSDSINQSALHHAFLLLKNAFEAILDLNFRPISALSRNLRPFIPSKLPLLLKQPEILLNCPLRLLNRRIQRI
jgi:hypothetical protein